MAQSKTPYKIVGIFPLTGYLSWLGEYKKKGSELKVELINKAGGINGRPLELVVYDDQSSPETGSRVAQRLVSKDGVIAMIGTASVPISGAVASIGNRYKIPTIIGSGYEVDPKKDYFVFRISSQVSTKIKVLSRKRWMDNKYIQKYTSLKFNRYRAVKVRGFMAHLAN